MMLDAATAGSATVAEALAPIVVALVTAAAAILAPRLAARSDDLKLAERLTELLDDLSPTPQRELLEQLRDDYATVWALRQAAPAEPRLRNLARAAYWGGVLILIIGPLTLLLTPGMQWWFWMAYLGGLLLLVVGVILHRRRSTRQHAFMVAELRRRELRAPLDGRLDR